jgi:hypothetical protein
MGFTHHGVFGSMPDLGPPAEGSLMDKLDKVVDRGIVYLHKKSGRLGKLADVVFDKIDAWMDSKPQRRSQEKRTNPPSENPQK